MNVEFREVPLWEEFYQTYGVLLEGEPNQKGWVNTPCVLPTHPKTDRGKHGGVNLQSGNYRCWNETCKDSYNREFGRVSLSAQREILFPTEFLMLTQGISRGEADTIVESFRLKFHEEKPPEQIHYDTFTSVYSPNREWEDFVKAAQANLRPDIPIVEEYCLSRGLRFETLKEAGVGYVPEFPDQGQIECLIHPYFQNGVVVGIRGRAVDGRKGGVKGSFATLYQLDTINTTTSRTVVLCEGETDTLVTRQLLKDFGYMNIPVLGIPGSFFRPEWRRHLQRFNRILLVSQSDQASQRLVVSVRRALGDILEVINLPFPPLTPGKDVADFLRLGNQSREELVQLLGLTELDTVTLPYILSSEEFQKLADQPPQWIIPGVLERGTKNLIVGEPKTYKTWLALQLVDSVVNCTPFLGIYEWVPSSPGRVILVEEEGSPYRLAQRWVRLSQGPLPSQGEGRFFVIHRQGVRLDDDESFNTLRQEVLRIRPDVIIFDPYAALHLQDENSVQGTMRVISSLNTLIRALPTLAVVVIHHSSKASVGPRGSSALWGTVDTQIQVERDEKVEGRIRVRILGRDLPDERRGGLEFTFNPETGRHEPQEMITEETLEKMSIKQEDEVLSLFPQDGGWIGRAELLSRSPYREGRLYEIVKCLIDKHLVEESGDGRRGSPKMYRLVNQKS